MIFSKLGRSLSRSSRSKFQPGVLLGGCGMRSSEKVGSLPRFGGGNGDLGFQKGYFTSIGASNGVGSRVLFPNPCFRRLFSGESLNGKNYENYYLKGMKEIPKGNDTQKSESRVSRSLMLKPCCGREENLFPNEIRFL